MTVIEQRAYEAIISMAKKNEPDYWEKLKHQYAGIAMQGLLANHYITDRIDVSVLITETASAIANALVEKYKKEE